MGWYWLLLALPGAVLLGLMLRPWREPGRFGWQPAPGPEEGRRLPAVGATAGGDAVLLHGGSRDSLGSRDGQGAAGDGNGGADGGGDGGGGGGD